MGERFIASVQYDDLKGTVAIDGHDSPFLHKLTKYTEMPPGYWPVGLAIHGLLPVEKNGKIPITLYGVRRDEAGHDVEAIIRFAASAEEFPVYGFSGQIEANVLFSMMKRIEIKVLQKTFETALNVVERNPPD